MTTATIAATASTRCQHRTDAAPGARSVAEPLQRPGLEPGRRLGLAQQHRAATSTVAAQLVGSVAARRAAVEVRQHVGALGAAEDPERELGQQLGRRARTRSARAGRSFRCPPCRRRARPAAAASRSGSGSSRCRAGSPRCRRSPGRSGRRTRPARAPGTARSGRSPMATRSRSVSVLQEREVVRARVARPGPRRARISSGSTITIRRRRTVSIARLRAIVSSHAVDGAPPGIERRRPAARPGGTSPGRRPRPGGGRRRSAARPRRPGAGSAR